MGVDLPLFIQTHFLALFIKPSCGATLWSLVTSGGEVRFGIAGRAFFVWVTWHFDTLALLTLLKWADLPPIWGYLGIFRTQRVLWGNFGWRCGSFLRIPWAMIAMIQDSADLFGLEQPDLDLDKGWKVVLVCFGEHQRISIENGLHYLQIVWLPKHLCFKPPSWRERPGNGCRSQAMHRCETKDTIHLEHWQK